jgi:hypothetical protein
MFQNKFTQLSTDFGRFVGDVSPLRSAAVGIQTLLEEVCAMKRQIGQKLNNPVVEQLPTEFSELRKEVLTLKAQITAMSPPSTSSQTQSPSLSLAARQPSPRQPPVPSFDSRIISDFPEIFAEFRGERFSLLWRGSRDGFKAKEFHRRCDGHANTLTVILDTKGNIFGGFTPVEWESRAPHYGWDDSNSYKAWNGKKADGSQRSFLFTLKNPHNISARKFALRAEKKRQAIGCDPECGPCFSDILVSDQCDSNNKSYTGLSYTYTNNTGLDEQVVFTGSRQFRVKEIEVFEISD